MTNNGDDMTGRLPDSVDDAAVSRLYRETAAERTPAHLDSKVLATARRGTKSRYALSVHWLRPMAWAATIGLCLAIVIDVNLLPGGPELSVQEPRPSQKLEELAAPAAESPAFADEAEREMVDIPRDRRQDGDIGTNRPMREEVQAGQAAIAADVAEPASRNKAAPDQAFSTSLQEAAEYDSVARMPALTAGAAVRDTPSSFCPADDLTVPARWLACIDALEAEGRREDAALERQRFELKYPGDVVQ